MLSKKLSDIRRILKAHAPEHCQAIGRKHYPYSANRGGEFLFSLQDCGARYDVYFVDGIIEARDNYHLYSIRAGDPMWGVFRKLELYARGEYVLGEEPRKNEAVDTKSWVEL